MRKTMVVAGAAAVLLVVIVVALNARQSPTPRASPPAAMPPGHSAAPADGNAVPGSGHVPLPEAPSENSRLMLEYPITMERVEAYVAAVRQVRVAGLANADLMARLRKPGPPGETPTGMGARLDTIPELKAILDRFGLTGIDLVIMPQVVMAGKKALAQEQEGHPLPPEQLNAACMALYRTHLPRLTMLSKIFMADLAIISGP